MKKWFAIALAVLVAVSAGYSGVRAASTTRAPVAAVTLTYAFWDVHQEPGMRQIADAFEKSHSNVKIQFQITPFGQYFQKLETQASGGALPDVFWMNGPNFALFASNGVLMALDSQIKAAHINLSNYPSGLVNLYTYKGKHYALAKDFDVIGLWYNKSLFQAAHVAYPNSSWTWKTFDAAAKKLTDSSKGVYGFAAYLTSQEGYYNTIFQNGGYVISKNKKKSGYDDPRTIGGLKFWTDLIKAKASPTEQQMAQTDKDTLFQSGKVAMEFGGDWLAEVFGKNAYTKDKADVAVLPKGKKRATVIHGLGNVIAAKTSHPTEAWQFVQFLGSKQAAQILAKTGTVIPAFKGTQGPWTTAFPQFHLKNFISELKYTYAYPVSQQTAKWNDLETKYLTKAWNGDMSITAAAKQLAADMNKILAQEK